MINKYKIVACVRKCGALGMFYDYTFWFATEGPLEDDEAVMEEWFRLFSADGIMDTKWELYYFVSIQNVTEEET